MAETSNGRRAASWITTAWVTVTALILLAPLVAMQFTDDVNWTVGDFVFAGGLLLGSGITYELASRVGNLAYQAGVVAALAAGVLIMWVTGAVGIIGSEANPGNQLYLGLIALAIAAAAIVRGRAAAMQWAMSGVALATALVPVVAFSGVAEPRSDVMQPEVFIATGVFAAMWALSAWFFHRSARD